MAKLGRPKAETPKDKLVGIRFTSAEYERLQKYAAEGNLTISEYIHNTVCKSGKTKAKGEK